jgi:hypothetical protein
LHQPEPSFGGACSGRWLWHTSSLMRAAPLRSATPRSPCRLQQPAHGAPLRAVCVQGDGHLLSRQAQASTYHIHACMQSARHSHSGRDNRQISRRREGGHTLARLARVRSEASLTRRAPLRESVALGEPSASSTIPSRSSTAPSGTAVRCAAPQPRRNAPAPLRFQEHTLHREIPVGMTRFGWGATNRRAGARAHPPGRTSARNLEAARSPACPPPSPVCRR